MVVKCLNASQGYVNDKRLILTTNTYVSPLIFSVVFIKRAPNGKHHSLYMYVFGCEAYCPSAVFMYVAAKPASCIVH